MSWRHTSPAAVPIRETFAEIRVLVGERGRLHSVDVVRRGIFGRDGAAALALSDKRTLRMSARVGGVEGAGEGGFS